MSETINKYDEVEPLTRARMKQVRVCVYHVHHGAISTSTSVVGESIAVMIWACMMYQVDILAGDGNKACYMDHPSEDRWGQGLLKKLLKEMVE